MTRTSSLSIWRERLFGTPFTGFTSVVLIVLGVGVALSWVLRPDREHAAPAPAPR